jgi:hypothetical protein
MDEEHERIVRLADVLVKCHGKQAMSVALRRAIRCEQLAQLDWSKWWHKVAERLAPVDTR